MSILVYNKDKIYDSETKDNIIRRAMKKQIKMNYVRRPICIPVLNMMLKLPIIKQLYIATMLCGLSIAKVLVNKEQKEFLEIKQNFLIKKN